MFTGIIQEVGEFTNLVKISSDLFRIIINCKSVLNDIVHGESISVNGVCLSVVEYDAHSFSADIMRETFSNTTFNNLMIKKVNLEKSLKFNSRIDGHFVTGHIDAIAKIVSLEKKSGSYNIGLKTDKDIISNIVYKGSIALNGVSLTVSDITKETFFVSIIPVTLKNTNLQFYKINDKLNIETDILGKYAASYLNVHKEKRKAITEEFLLKNY